EVLVMSGRIAVMNAGRVEQHGTPTELYERPRTRFVAEFLAVRNILEAEVHSLGGGLARLRTRAGMSLVAHDDGGWTQGRPAWVGVRPERLRLVDAGEAASDENLLPGVLEDDVYLGDRTDWTVRVGGETLTVAESASRGRS